MPFCCTENEGEPVSGEQVSVRAEGQSLENVARPLTAIEEATGTSAAARS
jgi:hypothetical protein